MGEAWEQGYQFSVFQLVSHPVIENQESGLTKFGTESGWPFIRF